MGEGSRPIGGPASSGLGPPLPVSSPPAPLSAEAGRLIGGKFRVVRELGVGGMGAVFEVIHEVTHHRRALKLLKKDTNDELVNRLLREASAAGRIKNPHIVETFDAGLLDTGEPYVLMELLEGATLFEYIRARGGIAIVELLELLEQACTGLHAAHEAGIVHRDVKPANLIVTTRDGKPFVKILDFGVSKFDPGPTEMTELTLDGQIFGTPAYMAPEQLHSNADLDRRVDIYALGVLAYTACAGDRPFRGGLTEMIAAITIGTHAPLWEVCPRLPGTLTRTIERAMAKEARERYATAQELGLALHAEIGRCDVEISVTLPAEELFKLRADAAAKPPALSSGGMAVASAAAPTPAVSSSPWSRRLLIAALAVGVVLGVGFLAVVRMRASPRTYDPPTSNASSGSARAPAETSVVAVSPPLTTTPTVEPAATLAGASSQTTAPRAPGSRPTSVTSSTSPHPSTTPSLRRSNPY